jgi:hypothetical protein
MNQFSLSWLPYGVSKLAALAQALITLSSPSAQSTRPSTLSTLSVNLSRPDHPEQDILLLWFQKFAKFPWEL